MVKPTPAELQVFEKRLQKLGQLERQTEELINSWQKEAKQHRQSGHFEVSAKLIDQLNNLRKSLKDLKTEITHVESIIYTARRHS